MMAMIENGHRLSITQCRRGLFGSLTKGLLPLQAINTSEQICSEVLLWKISIVSPSFKTTIRSG